MGTGVEIRCRDEIGNAPFVMLNDWVLWDKGISDGARVTYCALIRFARQDGVCFPGQARLAAGRGVTDRTLRDHLKELEARGLITIEQRGKGLTNRYWIEPLQMVYGSEENQWQPSETARQQCWSPVGSAPEPIREEGWDEKQRKAIQERMSAGAQIMQQATEQSKAATGERMVKLEKKRAQRVKQKVAVQAGGKESSKAVFRKHWERVFKDAFPDGRKCTVWQAADHKALTSMVDTYGVEVTKRAMEAVCSQWVSRYQVICKARGNPNLRVLWAFRDSIFPEVETGRRLDPQNKALRDDEYVEGTAERAKAGEW